jgi:hypothetical protein
MPQFFDRNNLTEAQRARWDSAMVEYVRVQEFNIDHEIEAMSIDEQDELLKSFRRNVPGDTRSLREHLKMWRGIMGGSAGDSKSALFARLLDGKDALPFPPPTLYSYPWYAVVEEAGHFHVSIGGIPTMGGQMKGTGGAKGECALGINQCAWAVISMNDAARRLMALQDSLTATARPEKEGSFYRRYEWSQDLLNSVLDAYAAKPEFIVRHGPWAEYRLHIGRGELIAQRGYIKDSIAKIEGRITEGFSSCGNVFDANYLYLNAKFGEITSKGEHPLERLEKAKARLAQLEAVKPVDGFPGVDRLFIDQQMADLEKDVADYESDPTRTDFIKLTFDDWVLEKAFIKAPFTAIEVQRLNEWQTQTAGMPVHPFTCGNRGDGNHGDEGGDKGVLIATEAGWVCPYCDATQDWAHAAMVECQPKLVGFQGALGAMFASCAHQALKRWLPAYRELAATGARGADVMVECLLRRQKELECEPDQARQQSVTEAAKSLYSHLAAPAGVLSVMAWYAEEVPSLRVWVDGNHPYRWDGIPSHWQGYRVIIEEASIARASGVSGMMAEADR